MKAIWYHTPRSQDPHFLSGEDSKGFWQFLCRIWEVILAISAQLFPSHRWLAEKFFVCFSSQKTTYAQANLTKTPFTPNLGENSIYLEMNMTIESKKGRRPRKVKISARSITIAIDGPERPYPVYRFSRRNFIERPRHNPFKGL